MQFIFVIHVARRICQGNRLSGSLDGVKNTPTLSHLFFTRSQLSPYISRFSRGYRLMLVLSVFFAISISASFAEIAGDYRSAGTGDWKTIATWQRFDGTSWVIPTVGQGWPGEFAGTGAVNIEAGHTVTISNSGITTSPMGTLTISGTLYLAGDNTPGGINFSIATQNIIVIPDLTPKANIYFLEKSNLRLPINATIYVRAGGLTGKNCSNQQSIFFGPVQFYSCAGGGSACGKFADLMNFGGNPIITLTSAAGTNIQTKCANTPIIPITYVVGHGAAGAIVTGLPSGVAGTYTPGDFTFTLSGTPTVSGTFNYTVTTTGPGTCVNAIASGTITVSSIPAAPTAGTITQPTCTIATGSVVLSGLPVGNWTINPGAVAGTGATTTISGLAASGIYNFTVTTAAECTSVASANVVINAQPPTPSAPMAGAITQPTCTVSTGSVVLNGLPATGNWTLTTTPGGATTIGTGANTTIFGLIAGTYSYTVTNSTGCTSEASANVVITAQPQTPTSPSQTIDCAAGSGNAVITMTSPLGADMEYSLDGGLWRSATNFIGVPDGAHIITVRNASGCTTTGGNFNILCSCGSLPAIALSSTSGSTCITTPITISGNTFTNATSVTIIEDGDGSVIPGATGASTFDFTYTPAPGDAGKTVTITVTTDTPVAPCIAAIATYTLTVNPVPAAPSGLATQPTCAIATGDIALSGLPATGIWTLTEMSGGTTIAGTGPNTTLFGLTAGTYKYSVTNSEGCTSATSADIDINAQPVTPAAPTVGVTDNCDGTFTLTASGYTGTLLWSNAALTPSIPVNTIGTYTVTQTSLNGCESLAGSGTAAIETTPPTFTAPGDIIINTDATCQYDASVSKTLDVTDEADNCPGILNATYTDQIAIDCEGSKIITRTWSLVDKNGNAAPNQVQFIRVEDNIPPTFNRPPNIAIPTDAFGVYDASIAATGDATDVADNCSTGLSATFIDSDPVIDGCNSFFTRTWSLWDNCGNSAADQVQTITITGYLKPVSVSIAASANSVCEGTSITFTATPTNGGTTPAYQWMVNTANAGTDSPVYSYTPANGDIVTCVMTSNETCTSGSPATSNMITMIMTPTVGTPVFALGTSSARDQGLGSVTYTATASDNTGITYSLDAASLAGGNTINSSTGEVTYTALWSWKSIITATATGCNGTKTAEHVVGVNWCYALFTANGALSCAGASKITGNVGTFVGATTGFTIPTVLLPPGHIDAEASTESAQAAAQTIAVYNDLAAITCTETHSEITLAGPTTLTPNVYCYDGALTISGDITLDGLGNPNAVFIFKINGALTTETLSHIKLTGLADYRNVYWRVYGAVVLSGLEFKGTIVNEGAFTVNTGAALEGRALSINGAIAITDNIITSDCYPLFSVPDNTKPIFVPPADISECVENLSNVAYNPLTTVINPDRPDYYTFLHGNIRLDLNTALFTDDEPLTCPSNIRWQIDFSPASNLNPPYDIVTKAPITGNGQPSEHIGNILFPGDGVNFNPVVHHITWWIKDCAGNESPPQTRTITIKPRPEIL